MPPVGRPKPGRVRRSHLILLEPQDGRLCELSVDSVAAGIGIIAVSDGRIDGRIWGGGGRHRFFIFLLDYRAPHSHLVSMETIIECQGRRLTVDQLGWLRDWVAEHSS